MSDRTPAVSKPTAAPLRVLVVEDEALVALDLEERLARLGYEVSGVVDNGADALSHLRSRKVDLILMDIRIRGENDGIQTAAALRQTAEIPVVFLTAHADEATLQRAALTEPFGYVLKPFDERELRATIEMAHYRFCAEARLRKMERWLATTLGSIGDGVIATDSEGRIKFINAMAEAVSGWTRGDAMGRQLPEVFNIVTKDGTAETSDLFRRALTEGVTFALGEDRFLRTRDGRWVPVDDSLAPIRDDEGAITGCVVIFRDNTAHLAAEKERRALEAKMQETQRLESLGVLASGIAHDFNNLLVAVTGNASLGRTMVPEDSPLVPCLKDIEGAAERAALLCRQMLDYAGKSQMALQILDLSSFVRETAQFLKVAIPKTASLVIDLPRGLMPLRADRSQLQQVIMNLVINGAEALGESAGTVTVRTRRFHASRAFLSTCRIGGDLQEGDFVMLEVSDTGPGMTPEVLARIFDPFFTTKFTGRGLGLAAVSGIVRSHGGALAVETKPGRGTTFQVLFPVHEITVVATPPRTDPSWRGAGRALVVDDEPAVRTMTTALLRHLGFQVDTAEDGEEGVAKATAEGVDYRVIVLDVTMPKLDGEAAFHAIRAQRPAQPVLFMSGYTYHRLRDLLDLGGPVAFVQKPFTISDLVARLAPLLPA
jgi:PAS domain S-box-containing protein